MILGSKQEKAAVFVLLALFLLLVLVFGASSYTAALGSDPFGIVHFARHLARGEFYSDVPVYDWVKPDWGPDESHFVLGGNYIKTGPRMYNKYTVGFPLLLALSIRVLGDYSVYYFNLIVLVVLLLALFQLANLFLRSRPGGRWLALSAPLILMVMVDPAWRLALRPSHDLAGIMFIVAGAVLAFRALGDSPRIRVAALLAGAFAFGCAGTMRLPNVLAAVPAGVYFLSRTAGRLRWWKTLVLALLGVSLFAFALSPALVQNQLTSGHPLRPPRPEIVGGERTVLGGLDQESPPPLWIGFFPTTFPRVVRYFWRLWGPLFTFLLLPGLISLWRRSETKWLLLGIPLILILLYSMWVHLMTRYMLVAHPFLIILMVAGSGRLLETRPRWWSAAGLALIVLLDYLMRSQLKYQYRQGHLDVIVLVAGVVLWLLFVAGRRFGSGRWRPALLTAVFFGLFAARYGPAWLNRPPRFQLEEARKFGADFDSVVPPGSVIFSTKPIFQYIYLFTSSYGLRPFEMGRLGIDPREGLDRLLARGTGIYLLDNTSFKRDSAKAVPLFREYFDLTPAGKLSGDRYHLAGQFGKPVCTVYRIGPWREKELQLVLELPAEGTDLLLAFNLRKIHNPEEPRQDLEIELNGRPLPGPFYDGMNFLRLPEEVLVYPRSVLTIRSDLPLPGDIDPRLKELSSPYRVDLAGEIGFPDRDGADIFNAFRFMDGDLVRLGWGKPGRVAIPTAVLPGAVLVVEVRVHQAQELREPITFRVALNGEEIGRFTLGPDVGRERFRFPLPERLLSSARSELEFTADRPRTRPLSSAEEYWGALLFESITVGRWYEKCPIPLEPGEAGFVAFALDPISKEDCPGPYRILLEGQELAAGRGEGVQRLVIDPGVIRRPGPRLEALGPDGLCRPLFIPPPLTRKAAGRLLIDIGGEDDWAFLESGFYSPELHRGRIPVRWTGPESRLVLPLFPREGREAELTLKTIGSRPPAACHSAPLVAAWLDGRPLGDHLLRPEDALYSWTIPVKSPGPRLANLTLRVDPWRPSDFLPVSDRRELGLMLEWVKLEYREAEE
ncbi:MAG: hypothetical protein P9M08_08415 [Candidatus Erginobacter occultus]|nr:hypothetical protein [Candidatus Erginobacter occultus]